MRISTQRPREKGCISAVMLGRRCVDSVWNFRVEMVCEFQCEISELKWYSNFDATSPEKELYHGGYARETLLGMFD